MQVEKNQDFAVIRIEGNIQQRELELQKHLNELIVDGKSKIILDIREAELDMAHRDLFEKVMMTANDLVQQQEGDIVFLTSLGRKINLRIPDRLDMEKFYMERQAIEFLHGSHG